MYFQTPRLVLRKTFSILQIFTQIIFILFFHLNIVAQDCGCTVDQVQSNTVEPCDLIIGTVIEVATLQELRNAINQANNAGGDLSILIADGTYPIASTASFPYITADNVVFRSQSGNRDAVIISGQGMVPTSSTEDGFLIAGNNVTIADLTIRDVGNHGIQVSGHNLLVHNVRIQDTYEQMIKGSSFEERIDNGIVQCSMFEYTAGVGPNWYIGGLDIHKGNNWIVRDNVFKNIASPSGSLAEHAVHFWNNCSNNTVERNIIYNCDRGVGFGLGDNVPQNDGGIIRNNMIYNDGSSQFHDVGIGLESSPNTRVYNNTIFIEYQNAIEYRFQITSNVDIVNNLTNKNITSRNGGTANLTTNITNAEADWFVDISTGDLHLETGHVSVLDQGTNLMDYVLVDIDQNDRTLNAPYDIGAQEFNLTSLKPIALINQLTASPNPAKDYTLIRSSQILNQASLKVFDMNGKNLINKSGISQQEIVLQLDQLNQGIYFLVLTQEDIIISTLKLIIQ